MIRIALNTITCLAALHFTSAHINARSAMSGQSKKAETLCLNPFVFTQNIGQWSKDVLFQSSSGAATMWIMRDGVYYEYNFSVPAFQPTSVGSDTFIADDQTVRESDRIRQMGVRTVLIGANPTVEVVGREMLKYTCNYFLGNDPTKWRRGVPNYESVVVKGIYPGIDLTYRAGADGRLKYDFLIAPGADAGHIRILYDSNATSRGNESMAVGTGQSMFAYRKASLSDYDTVHVSGTLQREGDQTFSFVVTTETQQLETATDLSLGFSTFLGGGDGDRAMDIAFDSGGSMYVVGHTYSADFPTLGSIQGDRGSVDVFVSKVNPDNHSLEYSTYLGGNGVDFGQGIAIDNRGSAYVTGYTFSANFPTLNPMQTDQGLEDIFVAKLSKEGNSLEYSTYLGGSGYDNAQAIAVDGDGCAFLTGSTYSVNFPLHQPLRPLGNGAEAFVTKLSSEGNALLYSTYLGGSDTDLGFDIAVDGSGSAYVTGYTYSDDYPTVAPYQIDRGSIDVFVTKLSRSGDSLLYSTYLGGSSGDLGLSVALDQKGCAYVTGWTQSSDFPVERPLMTYTGLEDVFVTKLTPEGGSVVFSTYVGGTGSDYARAVTVDVHGDAFITGQTNSSDFPTSNPFQTRQALEDVFVTGLTATGQEFLYSTYLGGTQAEDADGIAVDELGRVTIAGYTFSADFPLSGSYASNLAGGADAFITRLDIVAGCCSETTGNVNVTGIVDLSDLSALVNYLTSGGYALPCPNEANVNGAGIVDLSDLSSLVSYLTGGGYMLPSCP